MALIDDLKRELGLTQSDPLREMLAAEPPPEPEPEPLDQQVLSATSSDMSQPIDEGASSGAGNLGHPDVLAFVKELENKGAFQSTKPAAPSGMRATQTTVKSEEGGPDAEQRARGVAVRGAAAMGEMDIQRERAEAQAFQLEERAARLRQDADIKREELQQQEQENAKRQERLRSQQQELADQDDAPINPRRSFENMNVFQKGSSLVSAFIYGFLGGRGQPPVTETLMQMAKEDTAAQMANNAAARGKRSAQIEQYERQYGDSTLVAKRIEADKLLTMAKDAQAQSLDAKSQEAKAQAEDIAKQLKNRVGVLHEEIQEATFGKPVETTTVYQTPKGTGPADPAALMKKAADLNKTLAEGGYPPEQRAAMLKAAGLPAAAGVTMGEQKLASDEAEKARKAAELSPEAQTDMRKRVDGLAEMVQGLDELDNSVGFKRGHDGEVIAADEGKLDDSIRGAIGQTAQSFANALPWGMNKGTGELVEKLAPEDSKALNRARDKIVFGQAKAEGAGALGDAEREGYRQRIPTDSPLSVQRASAQIWRSRKQQYDNLVGQYGQEVVDEMLRKRGIDPKTVAGQ